MVACHATSGASKLREFTHRPRLFVLKHAACSSFVPSQHAEACAEISPTCFWQVRLRLASPVHIVGYLLNYISRAAEYHTLRNNCQTFATDFFAFLMRSCTPELHIDSADFSQYPRASDSPQCKPDPNVSCAGVDFPPSDPRTGQKDRAFGLRV